MGGHPAVWTSRFAHLFRARGIRAAIFAFANFPESHIDGIPVVRQFTRTGWHSDDQDDLLRNWDKYFKGNSRMAEDMSRLAQGVHVTPDIQFTPPGRPLEPEDVIVFTTITQYQLAGLISWYRGLAKDRRPTLICSLMAPSGYVVGPGTGEATLHSFDTARFYKVAFRSVEDDMDKVHFIALGHAHAAQYSYLYGKPVPTYPTLNTAIQPDAPLREEPNRRALLYAGAATPAKGAHHLPEILDRLCPRFTDWRFTVQAGNGLDTPDSIRIHGQLQEAARQYPNFDYIDRRLDDADYCAMFNESELVLVPYDPAYYYNQSSGVVWEAVATANTLVVPADCCLEQEVRSLKAAHVAFGEFTAASIADAVARAINTPPSSRRERLVLARRFKAENHPDALARQIFALWQPA